MRAHEAGDIDIDAPIAGYVDPILRRLNKTSMLELWHGDRTALNITVSSDLAPLMQCRSSARLGRTALNITARERAGKQSGCGVGTFLGSVSLPTRTMYPHGGATHRSVQTSERTRSGPAHGRSAGNR